MEKAIWCGNLLTPAADTDLSSASISHSNQDDQVKTPEQLSAIYFSSVGRGANLILNVPPDRRGQLHARDVESLRGFGAWLTQTFGQDLARTAHPSASNVRGAADTFSPRHLLDGDAETYWSTDDEVTTPELVLEFKEPVTFNIVRIREYLSLGQRIDDWALDAWHSGAWQEFARGSAIGARRLVRTPALTTTKVRVRITKAAACPALSEFGLFAEPSSSTGRAFRARPVGGFPSLIIEW